MHLAGLNSHMLRWSRLPARSALNECHRHSAPSVVDARINSFFRLAYGNLSSAICTSYFSTVPNCFRMTILCLRQLELSKTKPVPFRPEAVWNLDVPGTDLFRCFYSRWIPASMAFFRISSGHRETCTSPICAFRRKNIQILDWPMPPPIV